MWLRRWKYRDDIHNEPIYTNNTPTFDTNYSDSPAVSSEIFDIEYECKQLASCDINNNMNELFIDMNNINEINDARESEIESPSQSNQTDSPSYKYEYNFSDITAIGAIKTPKIETLIVAPSNEPNKPNNSYDLSESVYNETFELSFSDIELSDTNIERHFEYNRRKAIQNEVAYFMLPARENSICYVSMCFLCICYIQYTFVEFPH